MKVAFQGEPGAYSEMVAKQIFGTSSTPTPCQSFDDVFQFVQTGVADRGVVPVENSVGGTIHRNYDLLLRHSLSIIGERQLRISHCLIAHPDAQLEDISVVISHPQALAQCESRLRQMGLTAEVGYDTAGSVKLLAKSGRRDAAALASKYAAEVYGMKVLAENMQDHGNNYTRFVILARDPLDELPSGPLKASISFSLDNKPGALFRAMAAFALRDLDLTKIESRPIAGRTWEYIFYLDFVTSDFSGAGNRALRHLEEISHNQKLLGVYPRNDGVS